jgi:LacI family transcriptional regulator
MCTKQRWEGYVQGLEENNLKLNDDFVMEGGFNERAGQICTHLLLDLPHPPTAILTANDICAFGVMRTLQNRGYQPGKDISVIGFDDISLATHWQPPLTTISQPFRKIGFLLMQSLFSILSGEDILPQVVVKPSLIVRRSTSEINIT